MPFALTSLACLLVGVAAFAVWQHGRLRAIAREQYIRSYVFPDDVLRELAGSHAQLDLKDTQLVARALRQFFLVYLRSGRRLVLMPSKLADALWHAFIVDTRAYSQFCQAAFGTYLHHVLAGTAVRAADKDQTATWRTWRLACLEENINPFRATRLPLLFALDAKLGIPDAVTYDPSGFKQPESVGGCGGGVGCGGGCGGC